MYGDINNNYSTNSGNMPEYNHKPSGRKSRIFVYVALILVTSIISSVAAGSFIYVKLTDDLKKNITLASNTAVSESTQDGQASVEQALDQQAPASDTASDTASRDSITGSGTSGIKATALAKGSDVTAIAKKAGPSIVGIRMTVNLYNQQLPHPKGKNACRKERP